MSQPVFCEAGSEPAGNKTLPKVQNGAFLQPDMDVDSLNMLPTEEELLTCDCPFCVAYRGRSGNGRGSVAGELFLLLSKQAYTRVSTTQHICRRSGSGRGLVAC